MAAVSSLPAREGTTMTVEITVPYGVEIVRLPEGALGNYEVRRRHNKTTILTCGWISMGTGQPFAFGSDDGDNTPNATATFGGAVRVESRGSGGDKRYPGVKLHLED